jgi:hypothetical protein
MHLFSCLFGGQVHKITERHQLLEETILPREDETEAYNRAHYLNNCLTPIFLTALVLETVLFYFYTNMMHPWKKITRGSTVEEEATATTCFMCLKRETNNKFDQHMTKVHAATCPNNKLVEMCRE